MAIPKPGSEYCLSWKLWTARVTVKFRTTRVAVDFLNAISEKRLSQKLQLRLDITLVKLLDLSTEEWLRHQFALDKIVCEFRSVGGCLC